MATWYWVATAPANFASVSWATSSGGSATGQPATTDIAIFDGGSSQTCTIAAALTLAALDCQGGTGNFAGTLIHGAFTVTIGASGVGFRLSSGMTYTPTNINSAVTFTNTTGTSNITSAGHTFNAISRNGAGGSTQQQDNLSITFGVNASFTLTSGTWDCNNTSGFTFTATQATISGSTNRAFLGAGTITVGGSASVGGQTPWSAGTITNLTWTPNSAALVIVSTTSGAAASINVGFGALTYPTVTFATTSIDMVVSISGAATFGAFNVAPGWTLAFAQTTTYTFSTPFTLVGTVTQPIYIGCGGAIGSGQQFPILVCPGGGACSLTWGAVCGITASGTGGATFTAMNALQLGQTAGWSITPPAAAGLTPASIATAVWQDLLSSSDFTTSSSVGALLAAMQNLQFTVPAIGRGTCTTGSSTTSVTTSSFSPAGAVTNQFVGRVILFDKTTTTAALRGQVSIISASSNAANPIFTVGALTTTPASGDTFSVI
jgi:hypothetical protein